MKIQSARTRLALTYLAIIMALTIGFSAIFYRESIDATRFGLHQQELLLRDYLFFTTPEGTEQIRNRQLGMFRQDLLQRLLLVNLGMLALGGVVSYYLAKRSLRPLEQTLRAQSRFSSDAAHELRTPLTSMRTEIEVALMSKKISSDEAKLLLRSNLEEIESLDNLTTALLRLAKSSENPDTTQWQTFAILDIISESVERVRVKALEKEVVITLPKTTATVRGDSDQLVELFVTLLDNAIKYSFKQSNVTIQVKQQDKKLRVDIKDTGIGIAAVDMPHIFERFYRADQSRVHDKTSGYGLGLSLAESIAHAHHGKILAGSVYGSGSIFSVILPSQ